MSPVVKVLVLCGLVLCLLLARPVWAQRSVDQDLRELAKELNKSMPVQVDREKKLEVVVAVYNTMIFKYKFTDETVIDDPRFQVRRYVNALQGSLVASMCGDAGTADLFRRGAKYNYLMVRANGQKVVDFTLDHATCRRESR